MGKRGNENAQMKKEDYEAMEAGRGGGDEAPSGPFARASDEVMKKRRIIRTSGNWRQKNKAASMPTPSPSPLAANSNAANGGATSSSSPKPFAGFSFLGGASKSPTTATGTGGSTQGEASSAKANPFSNFSFTKKSTAASTTATSTATSAKATTSAMSLFPKAASPSTKNKEESLKLAQGFANYMDKKRGDRNSLKPPMEQYLRSHIGLGDVEKVQITSSAVPAAATVADAPKVDEKPAAPISYSFESSTPATTSASASAAPLFPPASSAPKVNFSFGKTSASAPASAPSTGGFSFGAPAATTTTSNSGAAVGGGFSFGGVAATGGSTPSLSTTSAPTADNDGAEEEEKAEPSTTGESVDVDWDVVAEYSVKACRVAPGLVKFAEGPVKLQKHKTNNTGRMVMRNSAGKVTLNLAIGKDMTFAKGTVPKKGRGPSHRIFFMGVEDAKKGEEKFCLVCSSEDHDNLHCKLQELAS